MSLIRKVVMVMNTSSVGRTVLVEMMMVMIIMMVETIEKNVQKKAKSSFMWLMMVMMTMTMMMIKMKTIEENVQNKARCSPMWASRPVLPPASGQILLLDFFFENNSKILRRWDICQITKMMFLKDRPNYRRKMIKIICTQRKLWHQTVLFATGLVNFRLALNSPFVSLTGFGF